MRRLTYLVALALQLAARGASATAVAPWSESQMFHLADDVATGVVEHTESAMTAWGAVESRATIRVGTLLKGRAGTTRLVLRQPGGVVGDLVVGVFGTTALAVGDAVLVYARRDRAGGDRPIAPGVGIYPLSPDGLRTGAAIRRRLDDPSVVTAPFTFLGFPPASRWFEFDRGLDVSIRSANADDSLGRLRSDALVRQAFGAWNGAANATVRLVLGPDAPDGPSIAGGVCDGRSVMQFNDPADELPDLTNCSGVLAVGGFCAHATAVGPGGATYNIIAEGDITVNRRVVDCFSERNVAEVLTHEIGHVLGLGHSSENPSEPNATLRNATMYFLAHFDARGASLRDDDVAGIGILYPADHDGDRIPDEFDQCLGTPARAAVDPSGCACEDPGHVACTGGDVCNVASCNRRTAQCEIDPVDCTGGEPCLAGMCTVGAGCSTAPVTGFEAIECGLERDFTPEPCAGERVPRTIRRQTTRGRSLVVRAGRTAGERHERLLDKATRRLERALAAVDRAADLARKRPLSTACAERLRLLVGDARLRVESRGTASLFDPVPGES